MQSFNKIIFMHVIVALSKPKPMQFSTFMLWNDVDFHPQ